MTSPTGAPDPGGSATGVEVGDVVRGVEAVVLTGAEADGSARSASPP
jgi:hypothetical protein